MTDQSNSNDGSKCDANVGSRRATLKKMLAGGGAAAAAGALPANWPRPVVDALVLPAHAATSVVLPTHFHGTVTVDLVVSAYPLERVVNALIPPAYARPAPKNAELCIDVSDGGTHFNATVQVEDLDNLTGSGTIDGSKVLLVSQCHSRDLAHVDFSGESNLYIAVTSISATEASFTLSGYLSAAGATIPAAGGCPTPNCGNT